MEETKQAVVIERINALASDKTHIREAALRLIGSHLQGTAREDIIERELANLDEDDPDILAAIEQQLAVIGDEIETIGKELEQAQYKPRPVDTSPMVKPTRVSRQVRIQETNVPPAPNTFDTTVSYPSDNLPEWFKPLQSIVEDTTFTSMTISLGKGKTLYHISLLHESN